MIDIYYIYIYMIYIYITYIYRERVHSVSRADLLKKVQKQNDCSEVVLVLTYHPALNCIHEIFRNAQRHVFKSERLSKV